MPSKKPKKTENLIERVRNCIALGTYRDTFYAVLRKNERSITLPEIIHVLSMGDMKKVKAALKKLLMHGTMQ